MTIPLFRGVGVTTDKGGTLRFWIQVNERRGWDIHSTTSYLNGAHEIDTRSLYTSY
jgi:hypothetical protein